MTKPTQWLVVENAGYVGECVTGQNLDSYSAADKWMKSHYGADEIESLHVDIAFIDADGGRSYDY